jgi:hypothetical protein
MLGHPHPAGSASLDRRPSTVRLRPEYLFHLVQARTGDLMAGDALPFRQSV